MYIIWTTCAFEIAAFLNQPFSSLVRLGVALHVLISFPCNHILDKKNQTAAAPSISRLKRSAVTVRSVSRKAEGRKTVRLWLYLIVKAWLSVSFGRVVRSTEFTLCLPCGSFTWNKHGFELKMVWAENHLWQTGWMQSKPMIFDVYRTSCLLPNNIRR